MADSRKIATLISQLMEPNRRATTISEISHLLGIETFVLFLPDAETGALLAAPGFPQTLPEGRVWRRFLASAANSGRVEEMMPWPNSGTLRPTRAQGSPDGSVVALIGGDPVSEYVEDFLVLVPLLSAALKGEQVNAMHAAQAHFAADLAKQATELARRLDEARLETQKELSARIAAEKLARTREQQLRAMVETTPECVKMVAQDGTLLEMNHAGCELVEARSREEVLGRCVYDLIAPEHRETFKQLNERVTRGARETLQFQIIGLQGTRRWMETHAVPVLDPSSGQIVQLALTRDITARKRDEALLAGEREVLELLARGRELKEVLATLARTAETQISEGLTSIFVLDREQRKFIHGAAPSLSEDFNLQFNERLLQQQSKSDALAVFSKERMLLADLGSSPEWKPFESLTAPLGLRAAWAEPIVASTGELIGTFVFYLRESRMPAEHEVRMMERLARFAAIPIERQLSDLALQLARAELQSYAQELEQRVAERTAKLSETVGELEAFSYSVAHDMRSPLRAMQGYASYVMEDFGEQLDPRALHALKKVSASALRLDRLIQDVLNYSRIVRGEFDLAPVNLGELIHEIVDNYPDWHRAEIIVEEPLPPVIGNEAFLTQCITNLVGNAIKFVSSGQRPRVIISARTTSDKSVRLEFQDNGIGIDERNQQRIFRIFERIHHSKEYDGTGIGLAIVRKAVERMGGTVGVKSSPGKGSVFWIQLAKAPL